MRDSKYMLIHVAQEVEYSDDVVEGSGEGVILCTALTLDARQPRAPEKQPAFKDQEMPEAEPELASGGARARASASERKRVGSWSWVWGGPSA